MPDGLASQPTLLRLAHTLSPEPQRAVLREGLLDGFARRLKATREHRPRYLTLDVDSLPIEVHGHQEGSRFNGHYGVCCYHPLVALIGETGDLIDVRLREGNVHTADGALGFILPLLDRLEQEACQVASVRMDAGFPEDELLSALEKRKVGYVARIRTNERLKALAAPLLQSWPASEGDCSVALHELYYQADSWGLARRVVLVLQEAPGQLFPHAFFLLTNWPAEQMPGDRQG